MTSLPRFSVENPVLVNLAMFAIIAGGAFGSLTLVREMFPESRPNSILVSTAYPGATPAEIEKGITLKIEEHVKDIDGVERIESVISEGLSQVFVELRSGFGDYEGALREVESAVESIPREDLPEEALESRVIKLDLRWPVISVTLHGDLDDRTLKSLGERLREDVLALPGLTDVVLGGTRKDEISVEVHPAKLVEYGVSFQDVGERIAATSLDLPGGQLRTAGANIAVRTLGERDWGDQFNDLVVRATPDGRVVRIRDVASVADEFEDVDVTSGFLGQPAASATIYKSSGQDAVHIATLVKALAAGKTRQPFERSTLDRLIARLKGGDVYQKAYEEAYADPYPEGVSVALHGDLSRFVQDRLDLLKRNGFWGLILVFGTLLVMLHWRVAFWVMMGLVLAVAGALIFMHLLGQTLNLISMFGLIIVLGLLVDDAIIVAENVYSKVESGMDPRQAAIMGTEEVTWPVLCAITTTIVAFLPLMNIEGRLGDWLGVLPVIVVIALSVSLAESLTILPSHLAHGIHPPRPRAVDNDARSRGAVRRFVQRVRRAQGTFLHGAMTSAYDRVVRTAVHYRYVTLAAMLAALLTVGGLVAGEHVPRVFLQKMDAETIVADLRMPVGTPIDGTQEAVASLERAAMALPELRIIFTLSGFQLNQDFASGLEQTHLGQLFIELVPIEERERNSEEILAELREQTADIPGVEKLRYSSMQGGPGGLPIHLEVRGERVEDLVAIAGYFKRRLAEFEGVYDIMDDFDAGRPEAQIELFDSAEAAGLSTRSLATQVRSAFYGFEARKIQRGREDVKVMVRYPREHRRRISDLESMYVSAGNGVMIPFREVARMTEGTGYATIRRVDQRRSVTVTADVDDTVTNANKVIAALSRDFPRIISEHPGVRLEFGGQQLETRKSFGSLGRGFVIAIILVYVILAGLFRSYIQPVIIMVAIPFSIIGAVIGHWVMGYPLTFLSMIGLVALVGIVVNDSLLMVAFINNRRREGAGVSEAVIESAKGRLRPIVLTSATTVLGLAPLLLEQSFQAKFLIPMGISISFGLIFSTVLTLVAVPGFYMIVDDVKRTGIGAWRWCMGQPLSTAFPPPDSDPRT
jgi:multidrug efflux pump subunit AcrB